MITAKRTTDQELVTRNSSSFKKLPNPPEEVIRESSPVPPVELQATLEFDGPETIEHTQMPANQEEINPSYTEWNTPSERQPPAYNSGTTIPSSHALFSRSGRQIRRPKWTKDYVNFSVFLTCILPRFMRNATLPDRWKISHYL